MFSVRCDESLGLEGRKEGFLREKRLLEVGLLTE